MPISILRGMLASGIATYHCRSSRSAALKGSFLKLSRFKHSIVAGTATRQRGNDRRHAFAPAFQQQVQTAEFLLVPRGPYAASCGHLAYYRALVARGLLVEIPDRESLGHHVDQWGVNPGATSIEFIPGMEGSASILSPAEVFEWFAAGLRVLGPAHFGANAYCHGTGSEGGLTAEGVLLLRAMQRVGMVLDVSHVSDRSFWESLDIYGGAVRASHHNCRVLNGRY